MTGRIQVADLTAASLTPDAKPVDTYYSPQAQAVQPEADPLLAQFAQSLGQLHPKLIDFASKFLDKQGQDEIAAGTQAYRDALSQDQDLNKKGFKDLVDQGVVPAGASPWFQQGWRQQQLRIMGDDYGRDLTLAWNANGDLKNSDDPGKLQQFIAGQQNAFMDKVKGLGAGFKASELTDTLDPIIDHYNHSVASTQINHRVGEIEKDVETNTGIEVGKIASHPTMSPEDKAAYIGKTTADMVSQGLAGSKANKLTTDAVVDAALAANDKSILSILPLIKAGTGNVGDTTYGKARMTEATQAINRNTITLQNQQRLDEERAESKWIEEVQGTLAKQVYHGQAPDAALMDKIATKHPGVYATVVSLQAAMHGLQRESDGYMSPSSAAPIINNIFSNTYPGASSRTDALTKAVSSGDLKISTSELPQLYTKAQDQDNNGVDKIPLVAQLVDQLKKNGDPNTTGIKMFNDASAIPRVISQFYEEVNAAKQKQPNATTDQLSSEIRKAYDEVLNWNRRAFPGSLSDSNSAPSNVIASPRNTQAPATDQPQQRQPTAAPAQAIQMLKQNPATAPQFNQKYGLGAAERVLGADQR